MISEPHEWWWGGTCLQCEVCGKPAMRWDLAEGAPPTDATNGRCEKHRGRNPCAIEGCKRSTSFDNRYANDRWLCSEHWRRFVPPHSPQRRAYHRFFRMAKRHGWGRYRGGVRLDYRFRVFWRALVRRARRQATDGRIDEDAINKLFGWEE